MIISIDLQDVSNTNELFKKMENELDFGEWGRNWDALNDCLHYLDVGGIWGTGKKFDFPLILEFKNYEDLQNTEPQTFTVLQEILANVKNNYAKSQMELNVVFL